jgi:signal transduction histidine kinase/DNA-binding response OmpR family regulator/HAMP domain-containing protein
MFSSRLFWRITFNFILLLIILSATTVLNLYYLTQIQKSYAQASSDLATTSNLDKLRTLLVDMQSITDDYLYQASLEKKAAYDAHWKQFDAYMTAVEKSYTDSIEQQFLRQVRTSFYAWVANIGDKKISLATAGLPADKFAQEIHVLNRAQTDTRYLETARVFLRLLYDRRLTAVPSNIESALGTSKNIATYIILVNVLLAIFAIGLGFVLTNHITKPVDRLRRGTQSIMKGLFEPITLKRRDEFGDLANDFNQMSRMLQNNYNRLTAYSELMTALNKRESVSNIEQASLEILCSHTGAAVGALYLLENDSSLLKLVSGYALKSFSGKTEYRMGEGIPGQCAAMKKSIEINDLNPTKEFIIDTGLVSIIPAHILVTPILFQENLMGVVLLGVMQRFDDLQREIINNSVPQIGVAIANAMNVDATRRLSTQIASKNDELNTKNAELQKAYRVKSDFLSNMSHELRTPLNSIIGFTSVLLGPHGDPLTPDQAKAMEKVLKNGKHLLELINDILDFSKIEAGRTPINLDTDEVVNLVSNAMITVEPMVTGKGVKLAQEIEPGLPALQTDTLKVKQILLNLLSNAAKFTDQGSITVIAKKMGSSISISVKDDGIGIEEKNLGKVFEEFQQIDSSSARKYKGTGLGLPIARNYARLLGGDLTVKSEFGKGSTFTLVIPPEFPKDRLPRPSGEVAPPKAVQAAPPAAVLPATAPAAVPAVAPLPTKPSDSGAGILILCIDDDPEVIDLLTRYLVPEGYSVRSASSGDEGIKLAEELHPTAITLDIMMPGKDGWQVLRELKANPKTKDIPVIIHSIIENRPLALSLGALEVITKPSDARQVLSVVDRACRSKSQPILIVDDDQDFADALKRMLQAEGYEAMAVYSGGEALKIIEQVNPSLLFLDLLMPGIDGFAIVNQLRAQERWSDLPIVILSAADIPLDRRQNLNELIQEFIDKGRFTEETISSTIKKVIAKSSK